jgi:hypothetical protein
VWSGALPRLPLIAFGAVYLFTCYVGVAALLLSARFRALYFIFAGADVPDLLWRDVLVIFTLVQIVPLVVWLAYELGRRRARTSPAASAYRDDLASPVGVWIGRAAFSTSVAIALYSLIRTGDLAHTVSAWFDYNEYVYTRFRFLDTLRFFEFVNLYTMLPLWAAYLVLAERWRPTRIAAVLVVPVLQYPLASRKPLLTSAILIGSAWYTYHRLGSRPRRPAPSRTHIATLFIAPACLYIFYLALTLQTVIRPNSSPFRTLSSLSLEEQIAEAKRRAAFRNLRRRLGSQSILYKIAVPADLTSQYKDVIANRTQAVILYTLLSPFTRTSISAVVYPVVFPDWHPFFHVDLGLDVLRIGTMPDDNVVVYRFLWPMHHRGQIGAPFHVVLYSQGGMWVALGGAFAAGLCLSRCWMILIARERPAVGASLISGLLITFSVFLAIDSIRNSMIVSYGVMWGALSIAAAVSFVRLANRVGGRSLAHALP